MVPAVAVGDGEEADMVDEEALRRCEIHRSLNQSYPSDNGAGRREEKLNRSGAHVFPPCLIEGKF